MAKVTFSKLGLKINTDIKTIKFNNEIEIEVKQYLPINDKLEMISKVLNQASDENNFSNPIKLEVFGALEIIYAYTNLSFTEKQKSDPVKLYDILESNGLIDKIAQAIPVEEYKAIIGGINECSEAIYTYRNSILGILDAIGQDYSNLELDASTIQQKLSDPKNMELLRGILTKLG